MKRKLILFSVISLISATLFAGTIEKELSDAPQPRSVLKMYRSRFEPHFRVNVNGLYAVSDMVDSYTSSTDYFDGKINGGLQWGGGLEYMLSHNQGIELSYLRLNTDAPLDYFNNGVQSTAFDLATNYVLLGGNQYFHTGGMLEPFAGALAGVALIQVNNPDNEKSGSAVKFAWGAKAGLNIWATKRIGIKIQTGFISVLQGVGGELYFGIKDIGAGAQTYSSYLQFYLGGGLSFDLAR